MCASIDLPNSENYLFQFKTLPKRVLTVKKLNIEISPVKARLCYNNIYCNF